MKAFQQVIPSKSTISRYRFALDCSWAQFWRKIMEALLATEDGWFINLMADSSPMFGRDWFLMRYEMLEQESLVEHFRAMEVFQYFENQQLQEDESDAKDVDEDAADAVQSHLSDFWATPHHGGTAAQGGGQSRTQRDIS